MKSFKAFIIEQHQLEEAVIKKGAVAAYALQGRKHGNNAVRSYNKAKHELSLVAKGKSTDHKADALVSALIALLDGLASQRLQIGSISSQVTALSLL